MIVEIERRDRIDCYAIGVKDLEELIFRCGWSVVHKIRKGTWSLDAVREIERLERAGSVQSMTPFIPDHVNQEWWNQRLIDTKPLPKGPPVAPQRSTVDEELSQFLGQRGHYVRPNLQRS